MTEYFVNTNQQPNGDHEVHKEGCSRMPSDENKKSLGYFKNCHGAVQKAKEDFPTADGCYYCSEECHTS